MKYEIFISFVWVFCSNIVASYHPQYPSGYRQGAYHNVDWSNNQNYMYNQNPAWPNPQPAINYGPPQHVPDHAQSPPELQLATNLQEQKQESIDVQQQQEDNSQQQQHQQHVVENSEQSQSEHVYVEQQPPLLMPQTYAEAPRPNYEIGPQPTPWQSFPDSYLPQVPRQWPQLLNPYQPSPNIPQEPYPQSGVYPHWSLSGFQNLPPQHQYLGGSYEGQNTYNTQVQHPEQAAALAYSEKNYRELLARKPEVKEYITGSAAQKKAYLLIHPNGTIEHVDAVDDSLLVNSKRFKSSDILNEKDSQKKGGSQLNQNPIDKEIGAPQSAPDNHNINPDEPYQNYNKESEYIPQANAPKETKPGIESPVSEDNGKNNYHPRFRQIQTDKGNHSEGSTIPLAPNDVPYNKYRRYPVFKEPTKNNENPAYEQKITPTPIVPVWKNDNYRNPNERLKSKTDIVDKGKETEDIKDDTNSPINEYNNNNKYDSKYSYPIKSNWESSSILSSTKTVEANKYNQKSTFDSSSRNAQNNYYNPSGNKNSETFSRVNYNNGDDRIPAKYTLSTQPSYASDDDSNALDEATTTLPYSFQNHSKKVDEINTEGQTYVSSTGEDYNKKQNSRQESKGDTSSYVESYPGNVNPTTDRNKNDAVSDNSYVTAQQDDSDSEYYDSDSDNNEDMTRTNETNRTRSDTQGYEGETEDDEEQELQEYSSTTTAVDITMSSKDKESSSNEDCSTNDTKKTGDKREVEEQKNITIEETKSDDKLGVTEVVTDFANLKHVSKSMYWLRPDDDFWEQLYNGNETGDYDRLFIINVHLIKPFTKRTSESYTFENGTMVEETVEIIYENKDDPIPRQITETKVTTNPGPDSTHAKKHTCDKTEDAASPKCKT